MAAKRLSDTPAKGAGGRVCKPGHPISSETFHASASCFDSILDLMEIISIRHKGLRRFFETGNPKGLVGDVARLRKMLALIDAAEGMDELLVPPNFGLHELAGNGKSPRSMTVTCNWRLTFNLNEEGAMIDTDLEDYHGA
ncbi:MAG: type II toxin-antitoxin system RelE/ParE family toxin [Pontixanthobacter sp.]